MYYTNFIKGTFIKYKNFTEVYRMVRICLENCQSINENKFWLTKLTKFDRSEEGKENGDESLVMCTMDINLHTN